jgi:hypothetical protein
MSGAGMALGMRQRLKQFYLNVKERMNQELGTSELDIIIVNLSDFSSHCTTFLSLFTI